MKKTVVEVNKISKEYNIDPLYNYYTLRDLISDVPRFLFKKQKVRRERFWALKDISFKVCKGDVIGIIGRNGAGKSTLLKILARIMPPTSGSITINGRVASMLEVGTGFHQELTGRENIYLNGAILGMKKREIDAKFKQIVDFSEIGKFLDIPVKRYSSGMQVRLAFSVAAHLDPEILLLDEVLAVGDMSFQRKSFKKMNSIAKDEGRTVFFVSHNIQAVEALCNKVILLEEGKVVKIGKPMDVITKYISDYVPAESSGDIKKQTRMGNGKFQITDFWIEDENRKKVSFISSGQKCYFIFKFKCPSGISQKNVDFGYAVRSYFDQPLFLHYLSYTNQAMKICPPQGKLVFEFKKFPLASAQYKIGFRATVNGQESDYMLEASEFKVIPGEFYEKGIMFHQGHSPFNIDGNWVLEK